jgi:NADPH:quinone reductase-like Zn-dependent oxidoreductase
LRRLKKIAIGALVFIAASILSLGIVLSYNSGCEPTPKLATGTDTMKANVGRCYGPPDVIELADLKKPTPADDEVLVKVAAASVNPLDWHYMRGTPYIMRLMGVGVGKPSDMSMGVDFSGTVEAIGKNVTQFKPGDEVYGGRSGAFAEYLLIPEDRALVMKPPSVSFEQAAAVPIAAVTALQALRDLGKLEAGQKVLINGASGGVGTFAVQIAKSMGAEVTGVCSTRNVEMVRSLGADHVFDYKNEDYTESGEQFDLIIDNVGNHSLLKNRKVLTPEGRFVIIGGAKGNWLGPLMRPINALLLSPFVDQEFVMILAKLRKDDLNALSELMVAGEMTSVIDRRYRLSEVPDAIRYSEEGHARGKIIIDVQ